MVLLHASLNSLQFSTVASLSSVIIVSYPRLPSLKVFNLQQPVCQSLKYQKTEISSFEVCDPVRPRGNTRDAFLG